MYVLHVYNIFLFNFIFLFNKFWQFVFLMSTSILYWNRTIYFTYMNVKSNNNVTTTRLYACSSHILSGRSDPNVAEAVRMWRRQAAAQERPKFVHRKSIPHFYHGFYYRKSFADLVRLQHKQYRVPCAKYINEPGVYDMEL